MAATESRYRVRDQGGIVTLEDARSKTIVSISPAAGNNAFDMQVNGRRLLWFPWDSLEAFREHGQGRAGVPFLGPWANRLDEQAFYANGRRFAFDMELGNVCGDHPIHGLLMATDRWQVAARHEGPDGASVTSRLDFYREPLWMKQFPFAHTIEMTHRLRDGALEVATTVENLSEAPMPVAVGFHPYFQLPDSPRGEWMAAVGARTHWRLADTKLPTGETEPIECVLPDPLAVPLAEHNLDHVFGDLVRDRAGRAVMSVWNGQARIDVEVGPNYRSLVVFAPRSAPRPAAVPPGCGDFICLEPMAGITNAMNLAHQGRYDDLQYIPPGGRWDETFCIRPKGF